MATRITDTAMSSDVTRHTATAWPVPDEPTLWSVTWLPGRAHGRMPGIRRIMTVMHVGDAKARLVQQHLKSLTSAPQP